LRRGALEELTPQTHFIDGKSWLNLRMPAEYSNFFGDLDNAVASFLLDAPIDPTRQPKIANVLTTLKQRSKSRDKLYKLNGFFGKHIYRSRPHNETRPSHP
jgi:hypothetical protein